MKLAKYNGIKYEVIEETEDQVHLSLGDNNFWVDKSKCKEA